MRHTVLVVDDEASIADGLRLTLEAEGYSVRIAGSVRTGLAAVTQADAHVAIVDLMLPDGDGLALTRELKSRDPALEVIVITAYGSVRKAMEATKGRAPSTWWRSRSSPRKCWGSSRPRFEHRKLLVENTELRRRLVEQTADSEILGSAPASSA
jgi:DNA-binding NtrC family response regulator